MHPGVSLVPLVPRGHVLAVAVLFDLHVPEIAVHVLFETFRHDGLFVTGGKRRQQQSHRGCCGQQQRVTDPNNLAEMIHPLAPVRTSLSDQHGGL